MRAMILLCLLAQSCFAQSRINTDSQAKIIKLELQVGRDQSIKWDAAIPIKYNGQSLWININTDPDHFVQVDGGAYLTLGRFKQLRINATITDWSTRSSQVKYWEINLSKDTDDDDGGSEDEDNDNDKDDGDDDQEEDDGGTEYVPPNLEAKYGLGPVAWQAVIAHAADKSIAQQLARNFEKAADFLNMKKGRNEFTVQQVLNSFKKTNASIWKKPGWDRVETAIEDWLKSDTTTRVQSRLEHEECFREAAEWLREIK